MLAGKVKKGIVRFSTCVLVAPAYSSDSDKLISFFKFTSQFHLTSVFTTVLSLKFDSEHPKIIFNIIQKLLNVFSTLDNI